MSPAGDAVNPSAWERADVVTATDAYARRFSGPVGRWFLEIQAAHTLALLDGAGEAGGTSVLEVGGGHAQLTPHLLRAGYAVTVLGSDERCGQRLAEWTTTGACRFDVGNLAAMPYPDRSFDAVLAFRLLPHVGDWNRFLAELCRVAGRCVILDFPSTRSVNVLAHALYPLKARVEEGTRPFRLFRPDRVQKAFGRNGFAVTGERAQFLFPMALHRALSVASLSKAIEKLGGRTRGTHLFGSPVIVRADRMDRTGTGPPSVPGGK